MDQSSRIGPYLSRWNPLFFWLMLALVPTLFYLAVSRWGFGYLGFPLDDAWIHQTYARNLARSGQLAFVPGVPSAGSTAPLWTLLLSLGYLFGLPFKLWTYGAGILLLGLTGWTSAQLGRQLFPEHRWVGTGIGLFCLFEWHLVWAAMSGMETILFVWLSIFLVERYLARESSEAAERGWIGDFGLGVIGGLLILTRPEGIGLIGLIGLDIMLRWWRHSKATKVLLIRWAGVAAGVGLMLIPYMLFHLQTTGLLFPNTLYAKQAEYGVVLSTFPLWWRLFGNFGPSLETVQGVFRVIMIGGQFLLLPGLAVAGWLTLKQQRRELWPIWIWWISYLLLYGLRLPVTYQHGRYQIPAIVWIVLLGVWGTIQLVTKPGKRSGSNMLGRVTGRALVLSLVILVLAFTGVGAQAYGRDVRFIESQMVATAKWLDEQTAPEDLIAAHDIGAIGYFSERSLIDLAGLITPEVIPVIRDEDALYNFIISRQANYLVTFPSWYPEMIQQPNLIIRYETASALRVPSRGDSMTVYQISD